MADSGDNPSCPTCGKTMVRNFSAEGARIFTDTIIGGSYISELPYVKGFVPSHDGDPAKRREHAERHNRYTSKKEINNTVREFNRGKSEKNQIHETSVTEMCNTFGVSSDAVDRKVSEMKSG